jgi:hypothetical protein
MVNFLKEYPYCAKGAKGKEVLFTIASPAPERPVVPLVYMVRLSA